MKTLEQALLEQAWKKRFIQLQEVGSAEGAQLYINIYSEGGPSWAEVVRRDVLDNARDPGQLIVEAIQRIDERLGRVEGAAA